MPFKTVHATEIPEDHPVKAYQRHFDEHKSAQGVFTGVGFDPLLVGDLLPWLLILDAVPHTNPSQYRYRFVGPKCSDLFGIDYTGKLLGDDLPKVAADKRREEFHAVVETRTPAFSLASIPLSGKEHMQVYRGVFPLAKKDENVIDQLHVIIAPVGESLD